MHFSAFVLAVAAIVTCLVSTCQGQSEAQAKIFVVAWKYFPLQVTTSRAGTRRGAPSPGTRPRGGAAPEAGGWSASTQAPRHRGHCKLTFTESILNFIFQVSPAPDFYWSSILLDRGLQELQQHREVAQRELHQGEPRQLPMVKYFWMIPIIFDSPFNIFSGNYLWSK